MKLPELKRLFKQNGISGSSYLNKPEIISRLIEKGVLCQDDLERKKREKHRKVTSTDEKYDRLKYIRKQSKRVEILDLETGDVFAYSSIYIGLRLRNRITKARD